MEPDPISAVHLHLMASVDAIDPFVADEPDSALVRRLCSGDVAALEMLYRQHQMAVRAFARRLLGREDLAEDLVHEVFLNAPVAFRRYRGESAIRTFLIAVAVNRAKHCVRSASRFRSMLERLSIEPTVHTGEGRSDEAVERYRLAHELRRALDQLPLDERIVVVLCEVEGYTASEVAEIVHAPAATIRTRLFRAKRKLRALLDRDDPDEPAAHVAVARDAHGGIGDAS